eukprot:CAMPEP_0114403832 /NCGR_PEP_ID=MMETSP0102-20121206/19137_1 /TAXON_ID=38822 ORGANISM="Pteridomonas danica, Strain PT" /NCGR_SAMPLE_ID=MMETSP0102 /ASSEMBLY_ACC=CAM_ASM_000212 /LENGTH=465 /DNA_ID=CAMNT_0001568295 /DNA_START=189 /DNA_END=1586 /DNA_ORIENTATION=+
MKIDVFGGSGGVTINDSNKPRYIKISVKPQGMKEYINFIFLDDPNDKKKKGTKLLEQLEIVKAFQLNKVQEEETMRVQESKKDSLNLEKHKDENAVKDPKDDINNDSEMILPSNSSQNDKIDKIDLTDNEETKTNVSHSNRHSELMSEPHNESEEQSHDESQLGSKNEKAGLTMVNKDDLVGEVYLSMNFVEEFLSHEENVISPTASKKGRGPRIGDRKSSLSITESSSTNVKDVIDKVDNQVDNQVENQVKNQVKNQVENDTIKPKPRGLPGEDEVIQTKKMPMPTEKPSHKPKVISPSSRGQLVSSQSKKSSGLPSQRVITKRTTSGSSGKGLRSRQVASDDHDPLIRANQISTKNTKQISTKNTKIATTKRSASAPSSVSRAKKPSPSKAANTDPESTTGIPRKSKSVTRSVVAKSAAASSKSSSKPTTPHTTTPKSKKPQSPSPKKKKLVSSEAGAELVLQ